MITIRVYVHVQKNEQSDFGDCGVFEWIQMSHVMARSNKVLWILMANQCRIFQISVKKADNACEQYEHEHEHRCNMKTNYMANG